MNRFFTKSLGLVALVGAMAAFSGSKAEAAFFTGQIDYSGVQVSDNSNMNLATKSAVSNAVVLAATGTFSAEGIGFLSVLNHTSPIVYRPVSGVPYAPLWTHLGSGITFDLLTMSIDFSSPTALFLSGTGVFHKTGYDDTAGVWNMTLQNEGKIAGSYSSTSAAVPEPASLTLLGLGLAGAAAARRRRATK